MLLTLLAIVLGVTVSGTVGLGITSIKLGKKINKITEDKDKYKDRADTLIEQLQDAQEENLKLSTQILDTATESITDQQMMQFIKANSAKFAHNWKHMSTGSYNKLGPQKKFSDCVVSEKCDCCGMIRRHWRDGDGSKYLPGYEGVFLGNKKICDEFRQIVCIGLLPLEFMSRNNSDMVKELTSFEDSSVNSEELEELVKRSQSSKRK